VTLSAEMRWSHVHAFGLLDDDFSGGAHPGLQAAGELVQLEGHVVAHDAAVARGERGNVDDFGGDLLASRASIVMVAGWPTLTLAISDSLSGTTSCMALRSLSTAKAELELVEFRAAGGGARRGRGARGGRGAGAGGGA